VVHSCVCVAFSFAATQTRGTKNQILGERKKKNAGERDERVLYKNL
jgi:hypothetical protein